MEGTDHHLILPALREPTVKKFDWRIGLKLSKLSRMVWGTVASRISSWIVSIQSIEMLFSVRKCSYNEVA